MPSCPHTLIPSYPHTLIFLYPYTLTPQHRARTNPPNFFFQRRKIKCWRSSETCFGKVWRRSEVNDRPKFTKNPICFLLWLEKMKCRGSPETHLAKFKAERSYVRGANGRSKFASKIKIRGVALLAAGCVFNQPPGRVISRRPFIRLLTIPFLLFSLSFSFSFSVVFEASFLLPPI